MDYTSLLQRKNELSLAYAIEPDPRAARAIHIRWSEVCNILNLLGYKEPEPTKEELISLIDTLED